MTRGSLVRKPASRTMKCDICQFETDNKCVFAGHRSGHVRSGELEKKPPRERSTHECTHCGKHFESAGKLAGHITAVRKTKAFEDIKTDGCRKKRLILELGHSCQVCGLVEWCGRSAPIEIDHIDGNPENNSRQNLRLICCNCHAQTETYRGRNVGKVSNTKRQKTMVKYTGLYR